LSKDKRERCGICWSAGDEGDTVAKIMMMMMMMMMMWQM